MLDLRRRDFVTLLGGAAAWPLAARAQQPIKRYRIGMLETISEVLNAANLAAFRKSLRDLGYIEGQNLFIDYRSADGRAERFPEMATELLRSNVDLIVTRGTPASLAVKNAAPTIPVVMAAVAEPLDSGLVAGLARPGGNVTGQILLLPFGRKTRRTSSRGGAWSRSDRRLHEYGQSGSTR